MENKSLEPELQRDQGHLGPLGVGQKAVEASSPGSKGASPSQLTSLPGCYSPGKRVFMSPLIYNRRHPSHPPDIKIQVYAPRRIKPV